MKIIFAVDGSAYSVMAANYLAEHFDWFRTAPELHLLFVKLPIPSGLAITQAERLLGGDVVDRYYKEESEAALSHTEKILRDKNIPFQSTYKVGDIAKEICHYAATNRADLIVMGSHGHGNIANLILGSVTTKVLALIKDIPVLVVRYLFSTHLAGPFADNWASVTVNGIPIGNWLMGQENLLFSLRRRSDGILFLGTIFWAYGSVLLKPVLDHLLSS